MIDLVTLKGIKCKETPEQADRFEIFLHYLQTGIIPYNASSNSESKTATLLRETCREEWRQIMEYLLTILESEAVYFRLLQLMPPAELKLIIIGISEAHSKKLGEDLMRCIDRLFNSKDMISSKYIKLKTAAMLFSECLKWKGNGPIPDLFRLAIDYLPDEKMRQSFQKKNVI